MELILDIFCEKRRVYIEWNQMICAVLLAFLIAGLYNYIDALPDNTEKFMREQAALAQDLPAIRTFAGLSLLPKECVTEEHITYKSKSYPDAAAKEQNFAVSYGYSEPDTEKRTKSAENAAKTETRAVSPSAEKKMDDVTRNPDIATGNTDIVTDGKEYDDSIANEKTGVSAADADRTDADRADGDETEYSWNYTVL